MARPSTEHQRNLRLLQRRTYPSTYPNVTMHAEMDREHASDIPHGWKMLEQQLTRLVQAACSELVKTSQAEKGYLDCESTKHTRPPSTTLSHAIKPPPHAFQREQLAVLPAINSPGAKLGMVRHDKLPQTRLVIPSSEAPRGACTSDSQTTIAASVTPPPLVISPPHRRRYDSDPPSPNPSIGSDTSEWDEIHKWD